MNRKERAKQINKFFQLMTEKMDLSDDEKLEVSDLFEKYDDKKIYNTGKVLKRKNEDGKVELVKVLGDKKLQVLEKSKK